VSEGVGVVFYLPFDAFVEKTSASKATGYNDIASNMLFLI
jgi:hypothetical protein